MKRGRTNFAMDDVLENLFKPPDLFSGWIFAQIGRARVLLNNWSIAGFRTFARSLRAITVFHRMSAAVAAFINLCSVRAEERLRQLSERSKSGVR